MQFCNNKKIGILYITLNAESVAALCPVFSASGPWLFLIPVQPNRIVFSYSLVETSGCCINANRSTGTDTSKLMILISMIVVDAGRLSFAFVWLMRGKRVCCWERVTHCFLDSPCENSPSTASVKGSLRLMSPFSVAVSSTVAFFLIVFFSMNYSENAPPSL